MGHSDGLTRYSSISHSVRLHNLVPHHLPGIHDWARSLAHLLETLHLKTARAVYQTLFEFWLKIFGVAFGLGVVSGVVMGFQFGTNWSVLSKMSGPVQGGIVTSSK
jgi:cytochrome d ubiquinol oxidase subunit I